MKMAAMVIGSLCALHLLLLLGVVGWAAATQRIDRERIEAAVALFSEPTSAEDEADGEEDGDAADEVERDATELAERAEQTLELAASSESIAERLESEQLSNEVTLRQIERTREEVESLRRNLRLSRERLEEQREELATRQAALDERLEQIEQQRNDEGFDRAVATFESLPPAQTKEMFVEMLDNDEADQVVDYLMAMQDRRAAMVMGEFETDQEIADAVQLTRMLRSRGSELVADLEGAP